MKRVCEEIGERILRVTILPEEKAQVQPGLLVEKQPEFRGVCRIGLDVRQEAVKILSDGEALLTETSCTFMPKEVTRYTFEGDKPVIVTKKTVDGERSFVENASTRKIADAYEAKIQFGIKPDEAIYGLGQHERGVYNYRNAKEYLYHNNMKIPMPLFLSSENYGIFFDCSSMMTYEEAGGCITVTLDAVEQVDYYIITGSHFDELVHGIRILTGHAVMLPRWAFGYVQSKERYKTQEEILETAAEFKKRDLPLGCIVLDWLSWEDGKWGNKIFDKSRFPDAKAMVEQLHAQGTAFMISIWPNCKEGCENHTEFAKAGKLYLNNSTYDAFDEEARDMYWEQCRQELFAAGTDAWWCDSTEPFTPDWNGEEKKPDEKRYEMAKDSTNLYMDARTSNAYCMLHAKGIYEHQRRDCDMKRVVNLTRSVYPGSQRYGTIGWSGDIAATWDVFRAQIAEGLSMAMSGHPYWTLDAGAFFTGNLECWKRFANQTEGTQPWFWHGLFEDGVKDKGYCELYTRWLQMAAFLPVMRSHGTDTPREPWQFGEEGTVYYDTIVKYMKLRYQILPYTYSLAGQAVFGDYTMMRSLMFDFAQDEKVKEISDEYMFGTAFLVCPVTEPLEYGPESTFLGKEMCRKVYLPEGSGWYDFETGAYLEGGQEITAEAPVSKMPLYVRTGSIIPEAADYSGALARISVYGGADGMFVYYDDNGQDYDYEKGEYTMIPLIWREEEKSLFIGAAGGGYTYPENFTVVYHTPEGGVRKAEVTYRGRDTLITV